MTFIDRQRVARRRQSVCPVAKLFKAGRKRHLGDNRDYSPRFTADCRRGETTDPPDAPRIPTSKTGKPRHVPLSRAAIDVIEQLPRFDGCPFLVPNPETKLPFVTLKRAWQTARREAGLGDLHIHDLRHSAASFMINAGIPLYSVGAVRFPLSLRNVEDLLFERGIDICHETVRFWWNRFGRCCQTKCTGR